MTTLQQKRRTSQAVQQPSSQQIKQEEPTNHRQIQIQIQEYEELKHDFVFPSKSHVTTPSNHMMFTPQYRSESMFTADERIKSFTKRAVGSSIVLYPSNDTTIEDWAYLANNKTTIELFKNHKIRVVSNYTQIHGILTYLFLSDKNLSGKYQNVIQTVTEQLKEIFTSFYSRTKLNYPLKQFSLDFNKGQLNFTLEGNFDEFQKDQNNQDRVLMALQDMVNTLVSDYKDSVNAYDAPYNFPACDRKMMRIIPEIKSMERGSIIFGVTFSSLFMGVAVTVAAVATVVVLGVVAYQGYRYYQRHKEHKELKHLDQQIQESEQIIEVKQQSLTAILERRQNEQINDQTISEELELQMQQLQYEIEMENERLTTLVTERRTKSFMIQEERKTPEVVVGNVGTFYLEDSKQI